MDFVDCEPLQGGESDLSAEGECPLLREPVVAAEEAQQRLLVLLGVQAEVERDSVLAGQLNTPTLLANEKRELRVLTNEERELPAVRCSRAGRCWRSP